MKLPAWLHARLGGWDFVVVLLGLVMVVLFATVPDDDLAANVTPRSFDWLAVMILALSAGALLLRHRYPFLVVVAVLALLTWWRGAGYTNGIINAASLVAFFNLGVVGDRFKELAAMALTVVPPAVVVLAIEHESWTTLIDAFAWPAVAILFGELSLSRRTLMNSYQHRAEWAEADREAEAQRRVAEERLRIARDLHDLLGHTVSLMTVQAGVAADKFDRSPERARAAIGHIRTAGRQATNEVRATVELLRGQDEPALAPAPSIGEIETLVANAAHVGLDVDCRVEVGSQDVDGLVGLTAYRVVQEALTNVVRHAKARHVSVVLSVDSGCLVCTIADDGRTANGHHPLGNGLRGMAERVNLAGGSVRHGPRAAGNGFEVVATLPARGSPR